MSVVSLSGYKANRIASLTKPMEIRDEVIQQLSVVGGYNYKDMSTMTVADVTKLMSIRIDLPTSQPILNRLDNKSIVSIRGFQKIVSAANELKTETSYSDSWDEVGTTSMNGISCIDSYLDEILRNPSLEDFLCDCGYVSTGYVKNVHTRVKPKSGIFYIYRYELADGQGFIKYGVSYQGSNSIKRARQCLWYNRRKGLDIIDQSLLFECNLPSPLPEELELFIKTRIPVCVVSKEDFPDGYTETCNISHENWLITLAENAQKSGKLVKDFRI